MKRAVLAALFALASAPAFALQTPAPAAQDSRVRTLAYTPNQIFQLNGVVGETLAIEFPADEVAAPPVVSDSSAMMATRLANMVWFKAKQPMDPQPITIATRTSDGKTKLYTFQWQARNAGVGQDSMYLVRVTDPSAAQAAAAAAWRARQAQIEAKRASDALKSTPAVALNRRYVGQGERALEPLVWDDGNSTFMQFLGNQRMPTVYVLNPDGKEAVADYSVQGNRITIHQTAQTFRLRDGDKVLCIFNKAFDVVGTNPGTGTSSPDVVREIR